MVILSFIALFISALKARYLRYKQSKIVNKEIVLINNKNNNMKNDMKNDEEKDYRYDVEKDIDTPATIGLKTRIKKNLKPIRHLLVGPSRKLNN